MFNSNYVACMFVVYNIIYTSISLFGYFEHYTWHKSGNYTYADNENTYIILFYINFTGVYLSLNNSYIPNHGYVVISDIGTSNDGALPCNTNRIPDSGSPHSGGDWYAPDGTRVHLNDVPGFGRNRGPGVVRLIRHTDTGIPAEGIYNCTVQDNSTELQSVYVGLYNSGGG